jgi:glutathione S-transferase
MAASLLISSRNYSSWSLRGWLLARMSGLEFTVETTAADDPSALAELLLRASSILVPRLRHDGTEIWDTLAIAEYLNETFPQAGMYPTDRAARARCRSISGEMHSGFSALRSSLPMNLRMRRQDFTVWAAARADIERILAIWNDCLETWHGPCLFGRRLSVADAMFAPVVTRLRTYGVALDGACEAYARRIEAWPDMREWAEAAIDEPEAIEELDMEF